MKDAICSRCGRNFNTKVPDDAQDLTCFACAEIANKSENCHSGLENDCVQEEGA